MKKNIIISLFLLLFSPYSVKAKQQKENTKNGHEYVDLGLPSGTLWATCNIGAEKPEHKGDYFMWGETQPLDWDSIFIEGWGMTYYDRRLSKILDEMPSSGTARTQFFEKTCYKYAKDITPKGNLRVTKYCTDAIHGIVDGKEELELEDDAACVLWGKHWRTPSRAQIVELIRGGYTTVSITERNGVPGCLVTGTKAGYTDKSIFFPYTGGKTALSLKDAKSLTGTPADTCGCYWLRNGGEGISSGAIFFNFRKKHRFDFHGFSPRNYGLPIRPVWQK